MQTAEAALERTIGVAVWKLTPSVLLTRIGTMRCWLVQEVCVTPTRQEY